MLKVRNSGAFSAALLSASSIAALAGGAVLLSTSAIHQLQQERQGAILSRSSIAWLSAIQWRISSKEENGPSDVVFEKPQATLPRESFSRSQETKTIQRRAQTGRPLAKRARAIPLSDEHTPSLAEERQNLRWRHRALSRSFIFAVNQPRLNAEELIIVAASPRPGAPKQPRLLVRVTPPTRNQKPAEPRSAWALLPALEEHQPTQDKAGQQTYLDTSWISTGLDTQALREALKSSRASEEARAPEPVALVPTEIESSIAKVDEKPFQADRPFKEEEETLAEGTTRATSESLGPHPAVVTTQPADIQLSSQTAEAVEYPTPVETKLSMQPEPAPLEPQPESAPPAPVVLAQAMIPVPAVRTPAISRQVEPAATPEPPAVPASQRQGAGQGLGTRVDSAEKATPVSKPEAIEALSGGQEIAGVVHEELATDIDATSVQVKWTRTDGPRNYWSTLSRRATAADVPVQLLHQNSIRILEEMAGETQKSDQGILFGLVSQSWKVALSGHEKEAIYLGGYFFFLNVRPGVALLHVENERHEALGGFPVVALSAMASFVQSVEPKKVSLSGHVYDGTARAWEGLPEAHLMVVGQKAVAKSDRSGKFFLADVHVWEGVPVVIDSVGDLKAGRTHRYQVDTEKPIALVLFSEGQINHWKNQVSGELNPEAALVIAAVPRAVSGAVRGSFEASTVAVVDSYETGKAELQPETYTIRSDELLSPKDDLGGENVRAFSLEVPAGLAQLELKNRASKRVLVRWLLTSPRVLSVVGPE